MEGPIQDIKQGNWRPDGNDPSTPLSESDQSARMWFERAMSREAGAPAEAIEAYRTAVTLNPAFVEAHHNLARLLRQTGNAEAAVTHARLAAALAATHPTVQMSLGLALEAAGDRDGAVDAYRAALALNPDYVAAHINLGHVLEADGRSAEAVEILHAAAEKFPDAPGIKVNLAQALLSAGEPDAAAAIADELIAAGQFLSAAFNLRGGAHDISGRAEKAVHAFTSAIRLEPDLAGAHENLALALLRGGRYDAGWREYEWRWRNPDNGLTKPNFPWPRWDGTPLKGRTLLLHGEQGLGDVIQFVRFAKLINKLDGELILACAPQLQRLLATAPGIDAICNLGEVPSGVDCYAPLMSLPLLLGATAEKAWPTAPYLQAPDGNPVPRLLDPGAVKIGVCWAGRAKFAHDPHRSRSFPGALLTQLLSIENVQLVGFQRGPEGECPALREHEGRYVDVSTAAADFHDDAALLMQMDLVVTADTALAHLAGALAIPTWLLLPSTADWRWRDDGEDTPWYPSMRLFRQSKAGDWPELIGRVTRRLAAAIGK